MFTLDDEPVVKTRASLVIDETSNKKITKQNLKITAGRPIPNPLRFQVLELVKDVFVKAEIKLRTHYADQFTQSELVRFKYVITAEMSERNADFVLKMLYEKLRIHFNIKQLTYLVPKSDQSFILIWM